MLTSRSTTPSSSSSSTSSDVLHLVELTKRWSRISAPVVDRLSLGVGAGEIVSLLGANKAGKTATLKMAVGEMTATSGDVDWFYDKVSSLIETHCFHALFFRGGFNHLTIFADNVTKRDVEVRSGR